MAVTEKEIPFREFFIKVGDGATPEAYAELCVFTTKRYQRSTTLVEDSIPDCTDPDLPSQIRMSVDALRREWSGSGKLFAATDTILREWFDSGEAKNARIYADRTLANEGGYEQVSIYLQTYNVNAERKKYLEFDATFVIDGEPVWVDASA
jgi:hypothetical protein